MYFAERPIDVLTPKPQMKCISCQLSITLGRFNLKHNHSANLPLISVSSF
jgi:hypothetical protein